MAAVSKPSQSSAQGRFAGTPNRIRRGRADYSGGDVDQLGADGCGRRIGWSANLRADPDRGAIVIANAREVNAGDFDPTDAMADLCEQYDAWLHVDSAFGLFARLAPATR